MGLKLPPPNRPPVVVPAPVVEFDFVKPFPETYHGKKFGPSLIAQAQAAGFFVLARISDAPIELKVHSTRWGIQGALEVLTMQGWGLPHTLRTVNPSKMGDVKL